MEVKKIDKVEESKKDEKPAFELQKEAGKLDLDTKAQADPKSTDKTNSKVETAPIKSPKPVPKEKDISPASKVSMKSDYEDFQANYKVKKEDPVSSAIPVSSGQKANLKSRDGYSLK